jgi:hypothetical protein
VGGKKLEYLAQQIKAVELIDLLKKQLAELNASITTLHLEIGQKELLQNQRYQAAIQKIGELTPFILKHDLPRQEEFKSGRKIEIDFLRDTSSLDGSSKF